MTPDNYLKESERTQSKEFKFTKEDGEVLHAVMGIVTEAGELMDACKRKGFYGKPMDIPNVIEEMGDLMWYMAILCRKLNVSLEEVMDLNIQKLKKRYPNNFNSEDALNRDTRAERKVFE